MNGPLEPLDDGELETFTDIQRAIIDFLAIKEQDIITGWLPEIRARWYGFRHRQALEQECRQDRARMGYSRFDAAQGTSYILLIIAGIAECLATDNGVPEELDTREDDPDSLDMWHNILYSIALGCRRYGLCLQYRENITTEEMAWAEAEANEALVLFSRWYKYFHIADI